METMLRNPGQQEILGKYGGKFNREWDLARLKGVDGAECCGVVDNHACKRDLNQEVQPGEQGTLVLMK
jgi:hypothetical protein